MVHYNWRGRDHAAVITDEWTDSDPYAARLTVFEQSNMAYVSRAQEGMDDQQFHALADHVDPEPVPETMPYEDMTKDELIAEAKAKGVSTQGNKADIIERLETAPEVEEDVSDETTEEQAAEEEPAAEEGTEGSAEDMAEEGEAPDSEAEPEAEA